MIWIGALAIFAFLFLIHSCLKAAGEWDDLSEKEESEITEETVEKFAELAIVSESIV